VPSLYFAAPLFSQAELEFNARLAAEIEKLGIEVFLPQRDGIELVPGWVEMTAEERQQSIFRIDSEAVYASDILLFVLDGRIPDEGACVELGLAHAHRQATGVKRTIVGLMTDRRVATRDERLNAMIAGALDELHDDVPALLAALRRLAA
jgi:nucleoside 2-deoxyribosyltransferase